MDKKIFFNASLPRAGSTLLQNIIGQNPDFHVTPTSGVVDLVSTAFDSFYTNVHFKNESNYALCEKSLHNYCREGIKGYYSNISQNYILDKHRVWLMNLNILKKLYKRPKIILLIRDLRSIFSSLEKQYLDHPGFKFELSRHYNLKEANNIIDRIKVYENLPLINYFFPLLQDIISFKNKDNIHIVKFEDLCMYPQKSMDNIYSYLEVPSFSHDFNNITQLTHENDNFIYFGKHIIKPQLEKPQKNWDSILSPTGSDFIYQNYNWFFKFFNYPHQ